MNPVRFLIAQIRLYLCHVLLEWATRLTPPGTLERSIILQNVLRCYDELDDAERRGKSIQLKGKK